jgi:phosphoribosylformimino-5-aminoimidazole carboxamide ribotide isomerase
MLILPAIDLRNGKCVNLVQGRAEDETVFSDDPVGMAERWEAEGAEYLHLVDLDGAFEGSSANLHIVKKIVVNKVIPQPKTTLAGCIKMAGALFRTMWRQSSGFAKRTVNIPVQLGGGIRTMERLDAVLALGVARAILGTAALKDPELVETACEKYGERIAVGIDAKDGMVATEGWLTVSQKSAVEFAREMEIRGIQTIVYTDIKSDGMLKGPNVEATQAIVDAVNSDVIGSGGVTSIADLKALKSVGASGAIIGRALYTGALELKTALRLEGSG